MAKKNTTAAELAQGEAAAPTTSPLPPAPVPAETPSAPATEPVTDNKPPENQPIDTETEVNDARAPTIPTEADTLKHDIVILKNEKAFVENENRKLQEALRSAREERASIKTGGYTLEQLTNAMRYAVSKERGKIKMDEWSRGVDQHLTHEARLATITQADIDAGLAYQG